MQTRLHFGCFLAVQLDCFLHGERLESHATRQHVHLQVIFLEMFEIYFLLQNSNLCWINQKREKYATNAIGIMEYAAVGIRYRMLYRNPITVIQWPYLDPQPAACFEDLRGQPHSQATAVAHDFLKRKEAFGFKEGLFIPYVL